MFSNKKNVKWFVEFKDNQGGSAVEYFDHAGHAEVFCKKVKGEIHSCDGVHDVVGNQVKTGLKAPVEKPVAPQPVNPPVQPQPAKVAEPIKVSSVPPHASKPSQQFRNKKK